MARITWKNVAAPNTGDAVRQQAIASRMINDGATGIGSTLQDLQTNNNRKLSAGAMQELGQIQDIGKFDELMKNGGLSQLGISADRASPELNQMLQGYRDTLEGKRASDQDFKEDLFRLDRSKVKANQNDWTFGRTQELAGRADDKFEQAEEQRLFDERVEDATRELVHNPSIVDESGLRDAAYKMAGDDKEFADALVKSASGRLDDVTYIDENVSLQPENQKRAQSFQDTQRSLREGTLLEWGAGKNDATRMLFQTVAGMSEKGFSNPLDSMLDTYLGEEPDGDGGDRKTYDETSASVTKTFNSLKDEFGDLPPELVAGALKHTVGGKGKWRFWQKSDELETKVEDARDMLEKYREEGDINQMQTDRNAFEAELRGIDQQSQQLESTVDKLRIALSKPDPDPGTVMELQAQLHRLTDAQEAAGGGNTDKETQKIIDEANEWVTRALESSAGQEEPAPEASAGGADQRANEIFNNPVVADVRGEIGDQANKAWDTVTDILRAADRGAGRIGDAGAEYAGTRADLLGTFASTFSTDTGTDMFNLADRIRGFTDNAAQNGIFGSAEGLDEEQAARDAQIVEGFQEERPALVAQQKRLDALRAATEGMSPEEAAPIIRRMQEEEAAATAEPEARVPQGPRQEPKIPQDPSGSGLRLPNRTTPVPKGNNGPRTPEIMEEPTSPYETVPGFDSTNPRAGGNSPLAQTSPETGIPGLDSLFEEAAQNPANALEAVLDEANLSSAESQEVEESLTIMQSGQYIRPEYKTRMKARLKEILEKAAQKRGGNNPQDPIAQLLTNPEKWLNL